MSYGLLKIASIDDEMRLNVYYGLLKLAAVDPKRRKFLLGAASAMLGSGQVKPVAMGKKALAGYGQALNIAAGMGTEAIPTQALKAVGGLNKHLVDIASARMYRMNIVNGASKEKALARVMLARRKRALEMKITKPFKTKKNLTAVSKVRDAAERKITGLDSFKSAGRDLKEAGQGALSLYRRFTS